MKLFIASLARCASATCKPNPNPNREPTTHHIVGQVGSGSWVGKQASQLTCTWRRRPVPKLGLLCVQHRGRHKPRHGPFGRRGRRGQGHRRLNVGGHQWPPYRGGGYKVGRAVCIFSDGDSGGHRCAWLMESPTHLPPPHQLRTLLSFSLRILRHLLLSHVLRTPPPPKPPISVVCPHPLALRASPATRSRRVRRCCQVTTHPPAAAPLYSPSVPADLPSPAVERPAHPAAAHSSHRGTPTQVCVCQSGGGERARVCDRTLKTVAMGMVTTAVTPRPPPLDRCHWSGSSHDPLCAGLVLHGAKAGPVSACGSCLHLPHTCVLQASQWSRRGWSDGVRTHPVG